MPKKYRISVDQEPLTLTQSATELMSMVERPENTLTLTQEALAGHILVGVMTPLVVTQTVTLEKNRIYLSAISTLELTQSVIDGGAKNETVSSTLVLTQDIKLGGAKPNTAVNTLSLAQSVIVRKPIPVSAISTLGLTQNVSLAIISNIAVTSYISLSQQAAKGVGLSESTASNHIHLTQSARAGVNAEWAQSVIQPTQTAVGTRTRSGSNALTLTQLAVGNLVASRSLTSVIVLGQFASRESLDDLHQWSDAPTLTARETTRFTYPYVTPTQTLELRNPTLGNAEMLSYNRINRKSRGGTLQVYRDANWPSAKRLKMSFEALTIEQRKSLLKFLEDSLGEEIGILDHESRQWRGIILTPAAQIAESKYGGPLSAGHSASLEFQGELV